MRKPISIRIQNIISVIPIINVVMLFIWIYNFSCSREEKKEFMKSMLAIFTAILPVVIIKIIIEKQFVESAEVLIALNQLMMYVIPLVIGQRLILFQKKHGIAE